MFSKSHIQSLYPIGSVVKLKGSPKSVMIIGFCQTDAEHPENDYDYLGVLYPEGFVGSGSQFFFNADAIESVVFEGYQSDELNVLKERIAAFFESKAAE